MFSYKHLGDQVHYWSEACQYHGFPFGLALSPRTFTKCMDAALFPLPCLDICAFNYIDEWLILAQWKDMAARHLDVVLTNMKCLGRSLKHCAFSLS